MPRRKLVRDLEVSAMGLGCMGMSYGCGATADTQEAIRVIQTASGHGVTFLEANRPQEES